MAPSCSLLRQFVLNNPILWQSPEQHFEIRIPSILRFVPIVKLDTDLCRYRPRPAFQNGELRTFAVQLYEVKMLDAGQHHDFVDVKTVNFVERRLNVPSWVVFWFSEEITLAGRIVRQVLFSIP